MTGTAAEQEGAGEEKIEKDFVGAGQHRRRSRCARSNLRGNGLSLSIVDPVSNAGRCGNYPCQSRRSLPLPAPAFEPSRRRSRPRSEEHTSELPSLMRISYAVFCLKKKNRKT